MTCNVMTSVGIPCYQVSLVVSGLSFWFDNLGLNPVVTTGGHLATLGYQHIISCRYYSSASDGYGSFVPSDWAVIAVMLNRLEVLSSDAAY